uniref:Uncharacterized protein n=1 Tax=Heliothis virescens TaxID=7102 RepID=A0A2A4JMU8_HELVI
MLSILGSNGKKIKIVIDTDDILKIFQGALNSDTIKKFAHQLIERDVAKRSGYKNPFHPEDDLVNTFDTALYKPKKVNKISKEIKDESVASIDGATIDIDKENDDFFLNNEVVSDDMLTENEIPVNYKANKSRNTSKKRKVITRKAVDKIISKRVSIRKDGNQTHHDDRQNYKPRQTRFAVKESENKTK